MKKKITLDELARMTANGFQSVRKDVQSVRKDVQSVRKDVQSVRKDGQNTRKEMRQGFSHVNSRLDLLEKDVKDIRSKLSKNITQGQYFELEERLTRIEEKIGIKY